MAAGPGGCGQRDLNLCWIGEEALCSLLQQQWRQQSWPVCIGARIRIGALQATGCWKNCAICGSTMSEMGYEVWHVSTAAAVAQQALLHLARCK